MSSHIQKCESFLFSSSLTLLFPIVENMKTEPKAQRHEQERKPKDVVAMKRCLKDAT